MVHYKVSKCECSTKCLFFSPGKIPSSSTADTVTRASWNISPFWKLNILSRARFTNNHGRVHESLDKLQQNEKKVSSLTAPSYWRQQKVPSINFNLISLLRHGKGQSGVTASYFPLHRSLGFFVFLFLFLFVFKTAFSHTFFGLPD